jgi:hypothetical protein
LLVVWKFTVRPEVYRAYNRKGDPSFSRLHPSPRLKAASNPGLRLKTAGNPGLPRIDREKLPLAGS